MDVEKRMLDWLKATFPDLADEPGDVDTHVGTETPVSFDGRLPFVRAYKPDGAAYYLEQDAQIEVDVFASGRQVSYDLSEEIQARLQRLPLVLSGLRVDRVDVDMTPVKLPWDNSKVVRFGATYTLSVRMR